MPLNHHSPPYVALLLALGTISAVYSAQQTGTAAQESPKTITSPEEVKKIAAQIADLIAPFTLEGVRNGFKDELDLWSGKPQAGMLTNFSGRYVNGQQVGYFFVAQNSGLVETRTMTKAERAVEKFLSKLGWSVAVS
jgi:hypothetical protein